MLKNKDWEGYLATVDELSNKVQDNNVQHMALMTLIQEKAPFKFIKPLLDEGALLDSSTVFTLIANDNIEMVEYLIPYGLDMYSRNINGQTALQYAQQLPASQKVIDFLKQRIN